ncbi:MAG: 3-hydroxyacyl-CoA dehydrogenase NAD-binding domain-containing protein [Balneolaceae bacterium]
MTTLEKKGNTAIFTLDDPGSAVNTLNEELMDRFRRFLEELRDDPSLRGAVLISGKENNFIAGADIDMFRDKSTAAEFRELSEAGQEIMKEIAEFPKPIIACIHGSCLGGGAELALACHYRIISDHSATRIGFPEVKLGLLPGTGGTQRLPRLIGIQKALSYLLTGKNMYVRQAKRNEFADEVTSRHHMEKAGIEAVQRLATKQPDRKMRLSFLEKLLENNPAGRFILFNQAHKRTAAKTRGNYPAPPQIIESVRYGYKNGLARGLMNESSLFGKLAVTPESKEMVRLFYAMNEAKKNPWKEQARPVRQIAVLGAGLMGSGITQVSAENELPVWLKDRNLDQAAGGEEAIHKDLEKKRSKGAITSFERDTILGRVHPTMNYDGFQNIDLVIEAVFEDLDLKRSIVADVEANTGDHCIFATNTSSLPISEIAAGAKRPENIIGMHYFSPVQKMPLLEIIKTEKTADWVAATACSVGLRQGKHIIVVNDGPGFYTTRILAPYVNEALILLEEGASIEQIDRAMKDAGFPVGPLALLDEVGIDIGAHVAGVVQKLFQARDARTSSKAKELSEEGFKGRKNKKGFYRYDKGKKKEVNPNIYRYFGGPEREKFDPKEIRERILWMMVNEAVHCLEEEILLRPQDGDLGAILGLGFPPFLGGPFRLIDREGASSAADRLYEMQQSFGNRFQPADLLVQHAEAGSRFYNDSLR